MTSVERAALMNNEAILVKKTIAFDGSAGNGAVGTVNIFQVTGDVVLTVLPACTEDVAGATATAALGTAANTTGLVASTTATNIDAGRWWIDSTPADIESLPSPRIVTNGADIVLTVGTANITDGTITFYALYRPLSADGAVAPA